MCANDPPDHKEKLQASRCSNVQKRNDQLAWAVTISAAIQLHCMAMTLNYPISKICTKWKLTLSSSMAMYSVMRDIYDARRVPMEKGWVAVYLHYVTCKYSNQLTLEQWAFENELPLFWYTLYIAFKLIIVMWCCIEPGPCLITWHQWQIPWQYCLIANQNQGFCCLGYWMANCLSLIWHVKALWNSPCVFIIFTNDL